jgi:Flp pilus assembly protein TadG
MHVERLKVRCSEMRGRGQATVEFALVLIFLLVPLLLGVAEIARAYYEHMSVLNAANVAARWATLTGSQQYCSGYASPASAVSASLLDVPVQVRSISTKVVTGTQGSMVSVSVAYSHTLFFGAVDSTMVLTGTSSMPGLLSTPVACPSCCPTPLPTYTPTATNTPTPTSTPPGSSSMPESGAGARSVSSSEWSSADQRRVEC